jgi:alkylhydroperoxidase/carboxymuconolactone decarboxylase family protein YurZ
MSIKLMSLIFETEFQDLKDADGNVTKASTAKLVLLAMADHASDDGEGIYPGLDKMEIKTALSRQGILNTYDALLHNGLIIFRGKSRHQTNNYAINVEALKALGGKLPQDTGVKPVDSDESSRLTPRVKPVDSASQAGRLKPSLTIIKPLNGADAPKIPNSPLDWKIAHGEQVTETDLLSEKTKRMLDVANLIATGTGVQAEKYVAAALAFMQERDIVMPLDGVKGYRRALREMFEANVQPEHIAAAVRKLVSSGLPCVDLHSVRRTAIDIANPPRETRASQDRDVLAEIEEMERTAVPNPGRRKHVA